MPSEPEAKESRNDSAARENHTETLKYFFETFKHVSTLSAGTLVLLTAVVDRLFEKPHHTYYIAIAFIAFIACVAGCLWSMAVIATAIGHPTKLQNGGELDKPILFGISLAVAGLVIGLATFAIFVFVNFSM